MTESLILVVDSGGQRSEDHVAALRRLGLRAGIAGSWQEAVALEPAALLLDDVAALGDARRAAPNLPILLSCNEDGADGAARALGADRVSFVSIGSDLDYAIALATLRVRAPSVLSEGDAGYALRLAALGEEIARIARSIEPRAAPSPAIPDAPLTFDPAILRATLKARRLRDSLFPPGTFADPTWDMLLDLAASRAEGRPVSVTSVAIAAAVPTSTALRHLKGMSDAGLIVRRPDPEDGRRIYIELTEDALARMRAWVAGAGKAV